MLTYSHLVHTTPQRNSKTAFSLWNRIKRFLSTLAREKFKSAIITSHFGFSFSKTSGREVTWLMRRHRFRKVPFSKYSVLPVCIVISGKYRSEHVWNQTQYWAKWLSWLYSGTCAVMQLLRSISTDAFSVFGSRERFENEISRSKAELKLRLAWLSYESTQVQCNLISVCLLPVKWKKKVKIKGVSI